MAQRPLIKDGVVANVIEIDDDCEIMTKAECRKREAAEQADYEERAKAWRDQAAAMRAEVAAAQEAASMARATVEAVKGQAANEKNDRKAAQLLRQILALEDEAKAHAAAVDGLRARPMPPKPRLERPKRWFHPDGHTVGPPGGNIGDSFDGSKYIAPEGKSAGPDPTP
jgi:hypothetical protein